MSSLVPGDRSRPEWARIESLFDEASERPPGERADWVRAVEPNPLVVAEVLSLLAAADRTGILDVPLALNPDEAAGRIQARLEASLKGRYRIERVLGQGGMATVFLARECKHDRTVVLKVLRPEVARWVGAERFEAEIQILARLSHPHIVGLIDSGEVDGLLYYVMPYLGGETLRDRLAAGPLDRAAALPLLRDIAEALGHAHAFGLVHRDLKPDNVLVVGGHAFLMDFGVAKLTADAGTSTDTLEGMAIGTPGYMAPEQAAGDPVDARTDVYTWGVVARETLGGAAGPLGPLIERTLALRPADRPGSGAALLAEFDRAVVAPRRKALVRRRLIGAGLVVVAGAAGYLLSQPRLPRLERVPGSVVVAPLRNETGDSTLTMWGRLAGDWLTQGLQSTGRAPVVPWPVALEASTRVASAGANGVSPLAEETGAGTVVSGAYYRIGDQVRFQVEFIDAVTGASLAAVPAVDVAVDSMDRGVQALRDRVMGVLAVRTDQRLTGVMGPADRPPTWEAYRIFERGLEAYIRQEYREASKAMVDAWNRDTTFVPALIYASRALWNTGERDRVDSLVGAIRARRVALSRYHDLQVRYLEKVLVGDGVGALAAIREAAAVAPGGRTGYNVALAALAVGRADEAVAELRRLDPDRAGLKGWAPYWYSLSHGLHLLGQEADEAAATRELRRRHPDSRAGWVHQVRVFAAIGQVGQVDSLLAEASALPPDTYWSQGAMMVTAGEELEAHGHRGGAVYLHRAVDWLANQLARDPHHRAHRFWMGAAQYDLRAYEDAEPYFESLVADYPDELLFRATLALIAAHRGDTTLARRRLGDPPRYSRGEYLTFQARLATIAGDRERALGLWSEALGAGVNALAWIHAAAHQDLLPLRDDPRFRRLGLLPPR